MHSAASGVDFLYWNAVAGAWGGGGYENILARGSSARVPSVSVRVLALQGCAKERGRIEAQEMSYL